MADISVASARISETNQRITIYFLKKTKGGNHFHSREWIPSAQNIQNNNKTEIIIATMGSSGYNLFENSKISSDNFDENTMSTISALK